MSENRETTVVLDLISIMQDIESYAKSKGARGKLFALTKGVIEILKDHLDKEKDMLIQFGYEQLKHVKVENGEIVYTKVPEEIFNDLYLHNYE